MLRSSCPAIGPVHTNHDLAARICIAHVGCIVESVEERKIDVCLNRGAGRGKVPAAAQIPNQIEK